MLISRYDWNIILNAYIFYKPREAEQQWKCIKHFATATHRHRAIAVTVGVDSVLCQVKRFFFRFQQIFEINYHPICIALEPTAVVVCLSGLDFKLISVNNRIPCPCAFCDILSAKHIGHGISLFHYVFFCFTMRSDELLSTNQIAVTQFPNARKLLNAFDLRRRLLKKTKWKSKSSVHRLQGITVNHFLKWILLHSKYWDNKAAKEKSDKKQQKQRRQQKIRWRLEITNGVDRVNVSPLCGKCTRRKVDFVLAISHDTSKTRLFVPFKVVHTYLQYNFIFLLLSISKAHSTQLHCTREYYTLAFTAPL